MILIFLGLFNFVFSQDLALQRPDPSKVMDIISDLNLSSKQKQDIEDELIINLNKYDKIRKKYEKKLKEKEELEKEIEKLRLDMMELNKNVTIIVRNFLTEEQKIKFADIIRKQKEKSKQDEKSSDKLKKEETKEEDKYQEKNSPFSIYFP